MNEETSATKSGMDPYIVSLDAGSSSIRTMLYDGEGKHVPDFGQQLSYQPSSTAGGGFEIDAKALSDLAIQCLDKVHGQLKQAGKRAAGVGFSGFWHSFLGMNDAGEPVSPIYHLFDTRSAKQAARLKEKLDADAVHARTGCVLHTSYWPAKLLWLAEEKPEVNGAAKRWVSFGEYLYQRLFGKPVPSTSMLSGTGLWDQNENRWDEELLDVVGTKTDKLPLAEARDEASCKLLPEFAGRWPQFEGAQWFPVVGDGACSNVGTGCVTPSRFGLMVGTTGAMRAVVQRDRIDILKGLWCYRVDPKRFVVGGALSNGGEVFAWMKKTLQLPSGPELEAALGAMTPGSHGLTVLPLFAGERSPNWRTDARAAFTGMTLHTSPVDILRAALESVALRFRLVYDLMVQGLGHPDEVVASGGALLHSPVWTQMMADALGRPVVASSEAEGSSRGAALLALERLGHPVDLSQAGMGAVYQPKAESQKAYEEMKDRMQSLYHRIFEEK